MKHRTIIIIIKHLCIQVHSTGPTFAKFVVLSEVLIYCITLYCAPPFAVCLFVWRFSSHMRIFHSYGGITITGERAANFELCLHLWPLSSEDSLACHTVYNGHLRGPWHLMPSIWQWNCHFSVATGIRTTNLRLLEKCSNPLLHRRCTMYRSLYFE